MICADAFTRVVDVPAFYVLNVDLIHGELPVDLVVGGSQALRCGGVRGGSVFECSVVELVVLVEEFYLLLREFVVLSHFEDSVDYGDVSRLSFEEIRGDCVTEDVLAVRCINVAHEDGEVRVVRTVLRDSPLFAILD